MNGIAQRHVSCYPLVIATFGEDTESGNKVLFAVLLLFLACLEVRDGWYGGTTILGLGANSHRFHVTAHLCEDAGSIVVIDTIVNIGNCGGSHGSCEPLGS